MLTVFQYKEHSYYLVTHYVCHALTKCFLNLAISINYKL